MNSDTPEVAEVARLHVNYAKKEPVGDQVFIPLLSVTEVNNCKVSGRRPKIYSAQLRSQIKAWVEMGWLYLELSDLNY